MSCSIMSGRIIDEQDPDFIRAFPESSTASLFLASGHRANMLFEKFGGSRKDRLFFGYLEDTDIWCEIRRKNGKLYVEIGEPGV